MSSVTSEQLIQSLFKNIYAQPGNWDVKIIINKEIDDKNFFSEFSFKTEDNKKETENSFQKFFDSFLGDLTPIERMTVYLFIRVGNSFLSEYQLTNDKRFSITQDFLPNRTVKNGEN